MSEPFAKLLSSIVTSSVWCESSDVRCVWVTMMALAGPDGCIRAAIPGLARVANVAIEDCELALRKFLEPDEYSRCKDHDGRRIEEIPGGWRLLSYERIRNERQADTRREQNRVAQQRFRQKHASAKTVSTVSEGKQNKPRSAQAEAEAEEEKEETKVIAPSKTTADPKELKLSAPTAPQPKVQRRWRTVPKDFEPNATHVQIAKELGLSLRDQVVLFKDYEFDKPKSNADAAFRNWLRRAQNFTPGLQNGGKGPDVRHKGLAYQELK